MAKEVFVFPSSFAQQRLWFIDRLTPGTPAYNISSAVRLRGSLDLVAFNQSLNEIISRHEILRTTFGMVEGQPVQIIEPEMSIEAPVTDLSHLSEDEKDLIAQQEIAQTARTSFDLEKGPLLRVRLIKLSDLEHIVLFTMHHIVSDAWSMNILIRELVTLYEAFMSGGPSPLEVLPIQYADYAVWQHEWLQGEVQDEQLEYWKQSLDELPPMLELLTDRPRPAVQSYAGATLSIDFDKALSESLIDLSRREGVTLYMLMLAAFQTLIYRYTGQQDIILGTPVSGRNRAAIEELIGYFVNTLVIRTSISGETIFSAFLSGVKDVVLEAQANQDLPFERLVEELHPERNLSRTPLFQVMFVFDNDPRNGLEVSGLKLDWLESETGTSKFDLTLTITELADYVRATIEYNIDLFNDSTIERMLAHYKRLCVSIAADPDQPVSRLEMLSEAERHQLLVEWNQTTAAYPQLSIQELFQQQVEQTPDAVAVVYEQQQLSYAELNARSNQLSRYLIKRGVGAEAAVGICLERSLEMVIAMLGIVKAGGCYVPLDAGYPAERLAFMLEDAGIKIVLTQDEFVGIVGLDRIEIISFDSDWEDIRKERCDDLEIRLDSDSLAYIIYTSGSTGSPKGVQITHSNIVRLFQATEEWFNFSERDVWTLFHSFAFDFSVWEIWGALVYGGRLVIVPYLVSRSPESFYLFLYDHHVTVLNQTPSAFRQLNQVEETQDMIHDLELRLVIFGGEGLEFQSLMPWFNRHGEDMPQLVNMYGITETTVHVSFRPITRTDIENHGSMIGKPIPDLQIYLLRDYLQPAPFGVAGEIYVGGAGVARGYFNRPDLTAERFIPDPFNSVAGARLYKSGDLSRRLIDGDIEYLGRIDQQVKIRGFRIEPAEIESALLQQAGIREAIVLAKNDGAGQKRLVAYVVYDQNEKPSQSILRDSLRNKLPGYAVPSAFVIMDAMPLNNNGKIDRRKLLELSVDTIEHEGQFILARTPVEEMLANIWCELLFIDQIGVHDNLFDLGGHSLLATQIISRIRELFKVEVPLRTLFETPTIAALSLALDAALRADQGVETTPIEPVDREGHLPMSFAQQRLWFIDQLEPGQSVYNVPAAIRLRGKLDEEALEQSIRTIINRHEAMRTSFTTEQGEPVQVINEEVEFKLEVIDLRGEQEQERATIAQEEIRREAGAGFDLERGPLFRAKLIRLGEEEQIVVMTMHHIISDGWSIGVLTKELAELYEACTEGREPQLQELPLQYADFAVWQQRWLQGEVLERQLDYWKNQLGENLSVLELPTDRPRPAVQSYRGAMADVSLSSEVSQRLKKVSRQEGATLFMTLMAAFKVLMMRYSGQTDIAVGTPIANRNRAEIEGLIGFFVNTLVMRTDLGGEPSFRELISREREVALGAYAHQDLPFEKLVDELKPERDMSRSPLFQVMFALQNAPMSELALSGLEMETVDSTIVASKYDLSLDLAEDEEGISGAIEYNTDLFDEETIRRMARHFEKLCESIAADADQKIWELEMLSEAERRQLLVEWNQTTTSYPQLSIQELFQQQVEQTPDAVAVAYEQQQLSYAELNARSNQLARYLIKRGVGAEAAVGICLERSLEMVIAMLGIVKAGGCYVPLDAGYPRERLAFMLEDAGVEVLVTQSKLKQIVPESNMQLVLMDEDWTEIAQHSRENPEIRVEADNAVNIIYTSGSTGSPKGVVITQWALSNHLQWMQEAYPLTPSDRILQKYPYGFDVSALEIYSPMMVGAKMIVARPGGHQDLEYLERVIREEGITVFDAVPTMLRGLMDETGFSQSKTIRRVMSGGEVMAAELEEQILERMGVEVSNLYGPTEATISATAYKSAGKRVGGSVPIGRAIGNTQVYVLGEKLEVVAEGVWGEICIGGAGLARGYVRGAEKTGEKFVPNPYSERAAARLYKTGDIGRYRRGGEIEYRGRRDKQVKVRGNRIELGEIEELLREQGNVKESVVVARGKEDKRLIGYVVAREGAEVTGSELREYLKRRVPAYMIPAEIVIVGELPRKENGKVDESKLPEAAGEEETKVEGARTLIEEVLVSIWSQVLGLERVSVNDNFFDLGGHSLLATRTISWIRKTLNVELPLRNIFESPTIAEQAHRIEEILRADALLQAPPITRAQRDDVMASSFAQQRLWFLEQMEPGSSIYNMPIAVRLRGELNITSFEACLIEIIRRHEVLRTSFVFSGNELVQVIREAEKINIELEDLCSIDESEKETEAMRLAREEAARGFAFNGGPLLRVKLIRLDQQDHIVVMVMHHIVGDGWSMDVLTREIGMLYEATMLGERSPLEELPIQYADYAVWQQRWLQGEVLQRQLDYWKNQLGESLAVLELPTDRPRPAVQSYRGAMADVGLSAEVSQKLKKLSRQEGATLFMTLMAAFKVLMMRYSGQTDIAVGTPIANRNRAEIEGLIGFFVNTLVMRTDLGGEPSVREVIRREREVALGAYAHQDLPFEKLVDELQPERDRSRTPLFQIVFAFENIAVHSLELAGLKTDTFELETGTSKFDLMLMLSDTDEGISGSIRYNTDLFDEATIKRMARHFEKLCESIAADADQKIWELEMLSEAERHQLLVEWNQTTTSYPQLSIQELFQQQVETTPDAVAVAYEQQQLSYAELNARSNQVARYLIKRGVGAEAAVGICLERSLEMVIAMLGIVKAGGCYVPLDAGYPAERLAYMLEDAGVGVLVSEQKQMEAFAEYEGEIVEVDRQWEEIGKESQEDVEEGVSADNLAYVIYTSGSTGRPKGVAITHRGVVRLVKETGYVDLGEGEVILQYAPVSFDASTFEIWGAVLNGGKLAIARRGRQSTRELGEEITEKQVSTLWLTAALFQQMAEEEIESLRGARQLLAGGDVLPEAQVEKVAKELPKTRLINGYGPTENTTFTSSYEVREWGGGKVPIGRPIANTRVYIVGKRGEVVGVGVEGEMYIGGAGLARGYYKRGDQTAEKFVPNEWSEGGGERLYRTGDVVRYLADGNIEFIGRVDNQVKVRGYRIELGEIEAVLNEHDEILKSAVIVKVDEKGDKRIIAYVVASEGGVPASSELRMHVKKRLPDYMVPSVFVALSELPITANGKIDRAGLPEPEQATGGMESEYVAPRTPIEEVVAGIWSELLRVERIGLYDNFFDLGGHSLLATRVNSWLRDVFQVDLPIGSLFETPTIAGLSGAIENIIKAEQGVLAPPITPVSRDKELLLSFAQQRLWFLNQLQPNNSFYNLSFAVRLTGHLNVDAMERSLSEIVRRHETMRTTLPMIDGHPLQRITPVEPVKLPPVDLSELSEAEQALELERLSLIESQEPFDLEHGPLWRILLLRFSPTDHVVLLTMHHIISDGWSMGLLTKEMGLLYEAALKGEESPLEELPIQYADYAAWQRQWLQGDVLETQLSYWKTQLEEFPTELKLPSDRSRATVESYRRKDLKFELSKPVSDRLKALSRQEGVTLFMTLLAAFKTLLYRYTRQDDIIIGTPIANRNRAEIEGLIGFFVNTLAMRTDLSGDPTFRELLKRVREVALSAYTHQDLPFERIVEELQPKRDKRLNPLFQILFILQNSPITALELPDLIITTVDTEVRSAMFDMIVILVDSESGLQGTITYNIDMYEAKTINGMIDHYKLILDEASRNPEIRLLDIPIRKNKASYAGGAQSLKESYDIEPFDF